MKEEIFYKTLQGEKALCLSCAHYCVIDKECFGRCQMRVNKNGKIYSLNYGKVIMTDIESMEKIGFFHFFPGRFALTITPPGSNWNEPLVKEVSFGSAIKEKNPPEAVLLPRKIIEIAKSYQADFICFKGEPSTYISFLLDTFKEAKNEGIKTLLVSNGYFSKESFENLAKLLDAANIILETLNGKTYKEVFGLKVSKVLENIIKIHKAKIHLEITTLALPKILTKRDFQDIARFIKRELGKETPWHILRTWPETFWKLKRCFVLPSEEVQMACDVGLEEGLYFVYGGNVIGLASEDTYCPKCQKKMIDRTGFLIERKDDHGKCSNCQSSLYIKED
jgi:pyruvate formate lyase activating enzyme